MTTIKPFKDSLPSVDSTYSDATFLKRHVTTLREPVPAQRHDEGLTESSLTAPSAEQHPSPELSPIRGLHPDIGVLHRQYQSGIARVKHNHGGEAEENGSKCGGEVYEQMLLKARRDVSEHIDLLRDISAIDITQHFPSAYKEKSNARLKLRTFAGVHPDEAARIADQTLEALQLVISQVDISIRALQLGAKVYGCDMIYDFNAPEGDLKRKRKPQTIARLKMNNGIINWVSTNFVPASQQGPKTYGGLTRNKRDGKYHAADIARLTCSEGYELLRKMNVSVSRLNDHSSALRSLRLKLAKHLTSARAEMNAVGSSESAYDIGPSPGDQYFRKPKK